MANIQIPVTKNGTTTLLTAGKYCPRNVDINVNVTKAIGQGHMFSGAVFDEVTGKYSAVCTRCKETVVWENLLGRLPDEVMETLDEAGLDLDYVYDVSAEGFALSGKWKLEDDPEAAFGKAVVLDTKLFSTRGAAILATPYKDDWIFLGDGASNTPLGYHQYSLLQPNTNTGYHIYKWKGIALDGSGHGWLNLWDNANSDGPIWEIPSALRGRQADLYLSIKTTGQVDHTIRDDTYDESLAPVFYIDRLLAVTSCDLSQEQITGAELAEGTVRTFGNTVAKEIRDYAFFACDDLTKVSLPKVTKIGKYAFQDCTRLETVHFPKLVQNHIFSFAGCTALKRAEFPVLSTISAYAFDGCTDLNSLVIGKELKTVCNLTHTAAFNNTPIARGTGCIYVPSDLVGKYKTATNWAVFADQIKSMDEEEQV